MSAGGSSRRRPRSRTGQLGQGRIGRTTLREAQTSRCFLPLLPGPAPCHRGGRTWVRSCRTAGAGVGHHSTVASAAPVCAARSANSLVTWLTIHADGSYEHGSSARPLPAQWLTTGAVGRQTGWSTQRGGRRVGGNAWGDEESPALVTAVETALRARGWSRLVIDAGPTCRQAHAGRDPDRAGGPGAELFVLLSTEWWRSRWTGTPPMGPKSDRTRS